VTDTLPRARLHAAGLAIAARTDDGARAALLDYLEESDDHELHDRAELCRLTEELEAMVRGGKKLAEDTETRKTCECRSCILLRRIVSLQSRLSAWPCRNGQWKCGKGRWAKVNGGYDDEWVPHEPCNGTGDMLQYRGRISTESLPLTWDCGYPRWVTLPTMADAVQEDQLSRDTRIRLGMEGLPPSGYAPTPRLRALASVPPWGVPLEGVRIGDRSPNGAPGYDKPAVFDWYDAARVATYPASEIPTPVFDLLRRFGGESHYSADCYVEYPTESAAVDALARAVITFAREYRT
jgi:hypothetical protein